LIRPNLNDEKYKLLENITDEAYAYIYDIEKYCDKLEKELQIIKNGNDKTDFA